MPQVREHRVRTVAELRQYGQMICRWNPDVRRQLAPLAAAALIACGGDPSKGAAPAGSAAPATPVVKGPYAVYVTNEVSGDLTVIDPATNAAVRTIPLGKRPRGIRSSPEGRQLYIALSGSPISPPGVDESTLPAPDRTADGIGVVDVQSLTLTTILKGPSDPEQTSVSRDGTRLYIANEDAGKASVLDIRSGRTIAEFEVGGEPEGVTTSTDGRFVYVTSEEENQVAVIDTATDRVVKTFPVGPRPRDSAFSPDSSRAYVTAENGGSVSVVDTSTHTVIETIQLTGDNVKPMGIVVSPDGQRIYVTTGRGGTVVSIDATTNKPLRSVEVGARPWGLAISPDGSRLYTANGPSDDVSVIDARSLTLVTKIPVSRSPWGVAIVPRRTAVSTEGVEERGDVSRVAVGDPHLRHGRAARDVLGMLDPPHHVRRRVREASGNVGPGGNPSERRADGAARRADAWNVVAGAAPIAADRRHSLVRVTPGEGDGLLPSGVAVPAA